MSKEELTEKDVADLTKGWDDLNVPIDGWLAREEGVTLIGTMQKAFVKNGCVVYLIKSIVPVSGFARDENEDTQEVELPPGSVVAVWESAATARLRNYVTNKCKVYIRYNKKVKLKAGKTMWDATVKVSGQPAPLVLENQVHSPAMPGPDDDIPF